MCQCIAKLEEKDFVEREVVYKDKDFKELGYSIRAIDAKGKVTNRVFHINYCPACGEKQPAPAKEKSA